MNKIIILCFLLAWGISLPAQPKTSAGINTGIIAAQYQLYDPAGQLKNPLHPWTLWEVTLNQEISPKFSAELAFSGFTYFGGVSFKSAGFNSSGNVMDVFEIPVRINYHPPLWKDKITARLHLGWVNGINQNFDAYGWGSTKINSGTNTWQTNYYESCNYHHYFPLLEGGLGFNFKLFDELCFSLDTRYQKGFRKIAQIEALFQLNNEPVQTAYYILKGDNLQVLLGLNYPFSHIWQQKQLRQSLKEERKNNYEHAFLQRFYLGLGFGPIWRTFKETHPEHFSAKFGRFSFWEFQYASLVKGILAGYQFPQFSIEAAYYRQAFDNRIFYAPTGFGHSYRDLPSNFNDLTLRFQYPYHFPFLMKRLVIVPYAGFSLLFSTASGNYKTYFEENLYTPDHSTARYTEYYSRLHPVGLTLNGGVGLEFYLHPKLILFLQGQLNAGFQEFNRISANLWYQNVKTEGDIIFKGASQQLMIGLKRNFDFNAKKKE